MNMNADLGHVFTMCTERLKGNKYSTNCGHCLALGLQTIFIVYFDFIFIFHCLKNMHPGR